MGIRTVYDTRAVAKADRFAFWREAVCDSYVQLGCEAENTSRFQGCLEIQHHSILSVSHVRGQSHRVDRRKRDIRSATDAYFLLSMQGARSASITQFDKTAHLLPGDMALYSSADPYTLRLGNNFRQTVVQLPAPKLIERLPNAEMLTARRIDGSSDIGKLVRENILAFAGQMDTPNVTLQTLLQDTLIDLIATGLASQTNAAVELSSPEQQTLLRAKSFIRAALGDPDLDRHRVAQEMGMSVRRLNEIFAKEQTSVSAFIRQLRLERLADSLRDPRFVTYSISELAYRYGFSNMQNLSRIFRNQYGQSLRAYRQSSE